MSDITVEELLRRNRHYAKAHTPLPTFDEVKAKGLNPPKKYRTAVVNCVDHRTVPEKFLQLDQDDAVLVFRNPGGHVAPILNGILALDGFLTFVNLLVIHHTDCGTTHYSEDAIRADLKSRVPERTAEIDSLDLGGIKDMDQSVRDDLNILKTSPFVRKELADAARGFIYDLKTGLLREVQV